MSAVLAIATLAIVARASWIQVVKADEFATASSLSEQADGGYRFEYNPRLIAAAREIERGSVYDRNGLPLATSRNTEIQNLPLAYREAGITLPAACADEGARCYPLGGIGFHVLGNWNTRVNWGAGNSSYIERDSDARLSGYDDRQQLVEVVNPRSGRRAKTVKRDYRDLLPLVRHRYDPEHPDVKALLGRPRDLHTSIDARMQLRTASALRTRIEGSGRSRGAAVVLDVDTGEVLAAVSYPWPEAESAQDEGAVLPPEDGSHKQHTEGGKVAESIDRLFDRSRYGLYPPGSTFKLVVAAAAMRTNPALEAGTFQCIRLPGGRVGNYIRGWSRPVRDDDLDLSPHGQVDLRRGLVQSCNAYFAQLAMRLGPGPILDAAAVFQIDAAAPSTAASLQRTLPHAGYGQGEVLMSPLKMARVSAAIAARGAVRPVAWETNSQLAAAAPKRFLPEAEAARLSRYMREVVTSGSGRIVAGNATAIAGKTGTAEVAGAKSHSWFTGFAPFGGPNKIAFAVIVENAGYGARAAAPVASEIVTAAREAGLIQGQPVPTKRQ
jgi:peptidoglycan glycosyltransferase